ncbi:TadG family pilus assembly protein [Paraburkholderia humisilvae]|uniref:DUF2134 domain-containing protein n=1 Tax=Paraburkholderia humisilvae TaxID=627669 RepID=A0A6J5E670_9BURK|nr:TadG family pilus assembly protein [Paraburkholderia humisilvae]CAB3760585.1 hypothetical protein LMG29542_03871 [Paraburkholderia humisilvae]
MHVPILPVRASHRARARQRGAVAATAALWLAVAVAALGVLDVGNVFLVRRQLQRTADMAASAGAQSIGGPAGCKGATDAATFNASGNDLPPDATIAVTCGRWDAPAFNPSGAPLNAVQVDVSRDVPYLFVGPSRTVRASATAKAVDVATFSLATSAATLSNGVLNGLLNSLLGTNLALGIVTYQNLAAAQLKLGDLAAALNAGSIDQLLNMNVTVADLVHAMATALDANGTVSADVASALGTIAASVPPDLTLNLGNSATANGLLAVGLADPQGALSARISALDALLFAAEIANGTFAVNVAPALNLGALANVSAQLVVIQPPVIAVGEAGLDADGNPRTSAHAAQVRLYVNLGIANINVPLLASIKLLNLPLYIEVANATASLQSTQCTASKLTSSSTIALQWGVASLCVSDAAAANVANNTQPSSCALPATVASVNPLPILGLPPLIGLSVGSLPPATPTQGLSLALQQASTDPPPTLGFDAQPGNSDDYQSVNTNALGSATAGLATQLAAQLPNAIYLTVLGGNFRLGKLGLYAGLSPVLTTAINALTPALNQLDTLLVPLLQALGVQVGVATVHDIALSCGEAQLVN